MAAPHQPLGRRQRRSRGSVLIVYLDTSALVKRYVREDGSDRVVEVCSQENAFNLVSSELVVAEMASSLARRQREGLLGAEMLRAVWRAFIGDSTRQYRLHSVDRDVLTEGRRLLLAHSLRTLDALHLATAGRIRRFAGDDCLFLTSDGRQEAAARAEGWTTERV
ncbi:MAG: type II toxin-antitoxin system VapC family toxin [Candidatus Sericytochromatia bacterium]|uniref:Ribonuclease VapC n=1 Tax=Candidatus Tanganyikabacteria bacterium TaxID=2961651 RepID=A0A938BIG0_9BACT|nr:type II toxin-antitoxin system VapC family toxin [Candidatus Tanganyikabacteria bacterium]